MIGPFKRQRARRKASRKLTPQHSAEVLRDFLLDSRIAEAQQMSTLLGLPEVTAQAAAHSEERAERIAHLTPIVAVFAGALASGVAHYYDTVDAFKEGMTPDELLAMQVWIGRVAMACTLGSLSQLQELDLLEVHDG